AHLRAPEPRAVSHSFTLPDAWT
ncbi:MAG: hypothetical protein JWQ03_1975, partial [Variovorax sp.]|nr:hypothetical protein [Variovorax sp.]